MGQKFLNDIVKSKSSEPIRIGEKSNRKTSDKIIIEKPRIKEERDFMSIKNAKFHSIAWIGLFGMIIVILINALNSFGRGAIIISEVARSSSGIYQNMMRAGEYVSRSDFNSARDMLSKAQADADEIEKKLWFLGEDISPQAISIYIIKAGDELIKIIEIIKKISAGFMAENQISTRGEIARLNESYGNFMENINKAETLINKIDAHMLTADFRNKIEKLKQQIKKTKSLLPPVPLFVNGISELLGIDKKHTALILLQNDSESRPTGGFIGSILFAEIENGKLDLTFQDVYDIDRGFQGNIEPPEEIKNLTDKWFFRDSNYSPDFTVSAKKALWFYEQERGIKADTVIAVNQSILKNLLEATGPITVPGLARPLDHRNYQTVISYIVEAKLMGAHQPKKILKDFVEVFHNEIFKIKDAQKIAEIFFKEISKNNFLGYSEKADVQNLFEFIGMDGRVIAQPQNEDYFSVISTSIGGNKTDQYVDQKIRHTTLLNSNGEIINEVAVSRSHNFDRSGGNEIKRMLNQFGYKDISDGIMYILGNSRNKSIFRVYAPEGSELIEASENIKNIKTFYDADIGKTYFSFVMNVRPGQTITANLKYRLPFRLDYSPTAAYRLTTQRQSGIVESEFTKEFIADNSLKILSFYPEKSEKIILSARNMFAALIGR